MSIAFLVPRFFLLFLCSVCVCSVLHAQQAATLPVAPNPKPWSGPWTDGNLAFGYTYLWTDEGGGERINLNGWFAKPALNVGRGWSVFADATNYYGQNSKGPINSHGITFGGQKSFFKKVKLGLFAEAGPLRTSNGKVTYSLLVNAGENLSIPLAKHFNLALTPAEYVMVKPEGMAIRNDFNSKIGFSIPF